MPNMDIDADASVIWHLLLDAKLATEDQLEEAYEESAQYNQPFVNILYNFDIITEEQLLQLIAENLGTEVYSFHKHEINEEIMKELTPDIARFYGVIPIAVEDDNVLVVAAREPLNHKLIEQKQLQLDDVAREAAKFVALFSGVDEVFTAQQLLHEDYSQRIERIRNSYRKNGGGDLVIILQPGWNLRLDDNSRPQPQKRFDVYPGPAIIFAPSLVKAERIHAPVEATTIAPTVAKIIRIRAPSACRALPLF